MTLGPFEVIARAALSEHQRITHPNVFKIEAGGRGSADFRGSTPCKTNCPLQIGLLLNNGTSR
jgi:hypothetical protein